MPDRFPLSLCSGTFFKGFILFDIYIVSRYVLAISTWHLFTEQSVRLLLTSTCSDWFQKDGAGLALQTFLDFN